MSKREKLEAALLGYAIGDALGKGTEFMERIEVEMRYPKGLRKYSQIYRDAHRSQWRPGEWTNDTTVLLNMGRALAIDNGALRVRHQAQVLVDWFEHKPTDVAPSLRRVLSQPDYTLSPLEASARVWQSYSHIEASNEALGRAMLAACAPGDPETNARTTCLLTHSNTICEGTSAIIGRIAHNLLHHDEMPSRSTLVNIAEKTNSAITSYLRVAYGGRLEDFELDDPDTQAYTRKATGAAIWCLQNSKNCEEALYALVDAGGDSDTNAALAVALVALRDGELNLPDHLISELENNEEPIEIATRLADVWKL